MCWTPYGDDLHEFSVVDVEEVVQVNKEKVAVEKREKEQLCHQELQLQQQSGQTVVRVSGPLYSGVVSSGANSLVVEVIVAPLDASGTVISVGMERQWIGVDCFWWIL